MLNLCCGDSTSIDAKAGVLQTIHLDLLWNNALIRVHLKVLRP